MHFLSLPYDVRHLIYSHLFPRNPQIYLQATPSNLINIAPRTKDNYISTGILRVNKSLHAEASEYLYSNYLFNIIGTKADCLAQYRRFLETTKKHARDKVRIDAFSNGAHSRTACLSIQSGNGCMALLRRRERGEEVRIEVLEREVRMGSGRAPPRSRDLSLGVWRRTHLLLAICAAFLAMLTALWSW